MGKILLTRGDELSEVEKYRVTVKEIDTFNVILDYYIRLLY